MHLRSARMRRVRACTERGGARIARNRKTSSDLHSNRSKTSFCNLSQALNCDLVNRSSYSTFRGIPVALIGLIGYLLILALATFYRQKAETPMMLLIASVGGSAFALYLTYLEAYVIHAWCILCLSSLIVILLLSAC